MSTTQEAKKLDNKALEARLDDFDPSIRRSALEELASRGLPELAANDAPFNLHYHTFFSYNPNNESPSHFAWLARQRGLSMAGIVDFDVLDGLEEFISAGELLGLPAGVSIESRVFIPEFAHHEINSPGEPGIAYHMGNGFTAVPQSDFLHQMRASAGQRNRELIDRVNTFTAPLALDYDQDVIPLTPKGNATERHLCEAYALKAAQEIPGEALASFWCDKLGASPTDLDLPAGPKLQGLIRAKTMKQGGAGYVKPGEGAFPKMAHMNRFSRAAGAIPAMAWLNGLSEGEKTLEALFDVHLANGTEGINIIPDRNFASGVKDQKLQNLYDVVAHAELCHFPIWIGTEMNSPGLRFVDDFDAPELAPILPVFRKGANILSAHAVLNSKAGLGYVSPWADRAFADKAEKNEFYRELGERLSPANKTNLNDVHPELTPDEILKRV